MSHQGAEKCRHSEFSACQGVIRLGPFGRSAPRAGTNPVHDEPLAGELQFCLTLAPVVMSTPAPLSSFQVRPRFEAWIAAPADAVHAGLRRGLEAHAPSLVVRTFPGFIAVHIPDVERRYWSPRLFLSVEGSSGDRTRIEGIYGPEIEIWSVFLYGYLGTGLLGTFSGIYGFVQLRLGQNPWGLWICGGMAAGALLLYLFAQLGQKLGAHQTHRLHEAYTAAAGELRGRG